MSEVRPSTTPSLLLCDDKVTEAGSPTVRRRRLAAELRRLRGNRTGSEVCRAVAWSPTKLSRAESGRERFPPEEVEKLVDHYGVVDPLRGQLLDLARDATQRGWWEDYAGVLPSEYMEFIGLEAEASSTLIWQADLVPGLFQTEAYARQVSIGYQSVIPTPPSSIEEVVRVRMVRQEKLFREPLLLVSAVIDEAVLLRQIGDRHVMRAQLEHLTRVAELPNVDLRVLPLRRRVPLVTTSFTVLSFGSAATAGTPSLGDVVDIESLKSELYIEGEIDTYHFRIFFQALAQAAFSPEESRHAFTSLTESAWA